MKKLLLTALLTLTSPLALALNDKPTPAPYQQLEGTFVLVRSVPEIEEDKVKGRFPPLPVLCRTEDQIRISPDPGRRCQMGWFPPIQDDALSAIFHEYVQSGVSILSL